MKIEKVVRTGDIVLVSVLIILSMVFIFISYQGTRVKGGEAIVSLNGKKIGVLHLDRNQILDVDGPIGTTRVECSSEGVRIVDSPCPHQYCIRLGRVTHSGQVLVCAPNMIAVRIISGEGLHLDGVTG